MGILLSNVVNWTASTSGTLIDGADRVSFSATSVVDSTSAGHYTDFYAVAGDVVTVSFMARITTEPGVGLERPGAQLELPTGNNISKVEVIDASWRRYAVSGVIPLSINSDTHAVRVAIGAFTSADGGAEFRDIVVDVGSSKVPTVRMAAYGSIFFNQAGDTVSLRTSVINHGIRSVAWDPTFLNIEVECDKLKVTDKPYAIVRVSGSGSDTSTTGSEQNLIAYCGDYNLTTGKVMVYFKNTVSGGSKVNIAALGGAITCDFELKI